MGDAEYSIDINYWFLKVRFGSIRRERRLWHIIPQHHMNKDLRSQSYFLSNVQKGQNITFDIVLWLLLHLLLMGAFKGINVRIIYYFIFIYLI